MKAKHLTELLVRYDLLDIDEICCDDDWQSFEHDYILNSYRIEDDPEYIRMLGKTSNSVSKNFYKHWCEKRN